MATYTSAPERKKKKPARRDPFAELDSAVASAKSNPAPPSKLNSMTPAMKKAIRAKLVAKERAHQAKIQKRAAKKSTNPGTATTKEMKAMKGAAPKTRKAVMKAKKRK